MNHASTYCKTLDNVTKEELVNALHQALMQLNAITKHETLTLVDNRPAVNEAGRILGKAGHPGFRATPLFVTRAQAAGHIAS